MIKNDNLIIVGNGFDVCHGYLSSYANFKKWLRKNDMPLYMILDKYIDVSGNWWNDFERNLSEFNVPLFIHETPIEKPHNNLKTPQSFSHPSSWRMDSIQEHITRSFTKWIKELEDTHINKRIKIPDASLYVSFNYTDILERVYGIEEKKILYIHGKASRGDKLIYGHGKNLFQLEDEIQKKYALYQSDDFFVPGTYGDSEFQLTLHISFMEKRPYDQIIRFTDMLLPAIKNSTTIWVYGLSFSEVDFPYIEWIVEQNPSLCWKVSWHKDIDKIRIHNTFKTLNVREYELFYL